MASTNIAVLGFGNLLLKDDGIGVWLIKELAKMPPLYGMEVYDVGTSVFAVPSLLGSINRILIADAVQGGGKPGTVYRFSWKEVAQHHSKTNTTFNPLSLHDFRLPDLKVFPEEAGCSDRCHVFGVEPGKIEYGYGLTKDLADKLPSLIAELYNEAKKMLNNPVSTG